MMYRSLEHYKQALLTPNEVAKPKTRIVLKVIAIVLLLLVIGIASFYYIHSQYVPPPSSPEKTYYISPAGNDNNDGLHPTSPWKSIAKVNAGIFNGGDSILFQGNATFTGNLELHEGSTQTTSKEYPVKIGSYGDGKATINGQSGRAIYLSDTSNIVVDGLVLVGTSSDCKTDSAGVYVTDTTNQNLENISLTNLDSSGFCNGIALIAKNALTMHNIGLHTIASHGNRNVGVEIQGPVTTVMVSHVVAFNNGVNGIHAVGVTNGTFDTNTAYANGGHGLCPPDGAAGIAISGDSITIAHTEIFNQRYIAECTHQQSALHLTGNHLVVQYNYSHDNDVSSLFFDTDTSRRDGVVRYNISENDASTTADGIISLTGPWSDLELYNNTIFTDRIDQSRGPVVVIDGSLHHLHVRNTIFLTQNNDVVVDERNPQQADDLLFQNNVYYDSSETTKVIWGSKQFSNVNDWAKAEKQETIGGNVTLRITSPLLCNPGRGGTMYPNSLNMLHAYKLQSISPIVDQGVDVWGMEVSSGDFRNLNIAADFYGNTVPSGGTFDIGANEYDTGQTCFQNL